jgi:hypothetical protein
MRFRLATATLLVLFGFGARDSNPAHAADGGSCSITSFGTSLLCGGSFEITEPGQPSTAAPLPSTASLARPTPPAPPLAPFPANGPNGPCMALGPANPTPNAAVAAWLLTLHLPACHFSPALAPPPPIDPATLAVRFWQTIPLPAPHPEIPPGYAITGKPAYLVTNGTLNPAPYQRPTPLGPLTISAHGSYLIDWGDSTSPTWTGPYGQEGRSYPNGNIFHTFDNAGRVTVTVQEVWTATWRLGAATGVLTALRTTATIAGLPVQQIQAVITG